MGDNATQVALESVGQANGKDNALTIAMLLDEAAGGRCDACRTTVEGSTNSPSIRRQTTLTFAPQVWRESSPT